MTHATITSSTITPEDKKFIVTLSLTKGIGPGLYRQLLTHFGSITNIRSASHRDLGEVIPNQIACDVRKLWKGQEIDSQLDTLSGQNIGFVTVAEQSYPPLLREIYDPPLVVYYKGGYENIQFARSIAVVGTRSCTENGIRITEEMVTKLVQSGFIIISGMAFGIDTRAHRACIRSGGHTIAVLSNGVTKPIPRTNRNIFDDILSSNGCIISEYPPETPFHRGLFPSRNRIIAGLGHGTLVIEAGAKSGALITARLALDYNREVFAVPGDIHRRSSYGTNALIQKGEAKLVQSVDDIVAELGIPSEEQAATPSRPVTDFEQRILDAIIARPLSLDEVVYKLDGNVRQISQAVTRLELDGMITKIDGNRYAVSRTF